MRAVALIYASHQSRNNRRTSPLRLSDLFMLSCSSPGFPALPGPKLFACGSAPASAMARCSYLAAEFVRGRGAARADQPAAVDVTACVAADFSLNVNEGARTRQHASTSPTPTPLFDLKLKPLVESKLLSQNTPTAPAAFITIFDIAPGAGHPDREPAAACENAVLPRARPGAATGLGQGLLPHRRGSTGSLVEEGELQRVEARRPRRPRQIPPTASELIGKLWNAVLSFAIDDVDVDDAKSSGAESRSSRGSDIDREPRPRSLSFRRPPPGSNSISGAPAPALDALPTPAPRSGPSPTSTSAPAPAPAPAAAAAQSAVARPFMLPPSPSCPMRVAEIQRHGQLQSPRPLNATASSSPSVNRGSETCTGRVSPPDQLDPSIKLDFGSYELFHLALHKALTPSGSPWSLSAGRALARQNWAADSRGRPGMERAAFEASLREVARNWAGEVATRRSVAGLRLLALDAGLGDDLCVVFLAALCDSVVRPACPPMRAALKPWFEVPIGCCSAHGSDVLKLLSARAARAAGASELRRPHSEADLELGSSRRDGAGAGDRDAPPRAGSAPPELAEPLAEPLCSVDLRRIALNNRMGHLLRIRRRSLSELEDGAA